MPLKAGNVKFVATLDNQVSDGRCCHQMQPPFAQLQPQPLPPQQTSPPFSALKLNSLLCSILRFFRFIAI